MDKHYLSEQARGLAMVARSEEEKNHILQMAAELDSMWGICNRQAQSVRWMKIDLENARRQHADEVRISNALRDEISGFYSAERQEAWKKYFSEIKTVKDLITAADSRSANVLKRLARKNDTLKSLYQRFQRVEITNFPNAGPVTKRNIQKLFEEVGVASS